MKSFKKVVLSLCVIILSGLSNAQQLELQVKDVKEGIFPQYFGNLVVRNPDGLNADKLVVTEGDTVVEITFQEGVPSANTYSGKEVLFLVLNHQGHDNRTKWYKSVITQAIQDGLIKKGDSYAVQSFDCNRPEYNSETKQLLYPQTPEFVNSTVSILNQVEAIDLSRPKFKQNCQTSTDIYGAIYEALEQFNKQSKGGSKARSIVIFADDFSLVNDIKEQGIIGRSLSYDIPVYGITYYQNIQRKFGVQGICESSYGLYHLDKSNSSDEAANKLLEYCDGMMQRASGMTYPFIFQSPFGKDSKSHEVQIAYNKEVASFKYNTPSMSFGEWIGENPIMAGGAVLLLIILIVVIIVVTKKKKRKAEEKEQERLAELKRVEDQQTAADLKAAQQEGEIRRMKDSENQKEKAAREEKMKEQKEAENAEKLIQMQSRGNLPWFTFNFQGESGSFEINHSEFTVGRDKSNHYRINLPVVSRNHFQIVFSEGTYVITDLNSSNGTYLNGEKITSSEIKHSDVVSIGDINLTFHI